MDWLIWVQCYNSKYYMPLGALCKSFNNLLFRTTPLCVPLYMFCTVA